MSASAFSESLHLLCTRRFGTFWFASLLSNIGTWAQQVAQPWLLLSLGASPFLLGLDTFALAAPVFLLTMVGGALADASDRRATILKYQSVQMLCPVLIVLLLYFHATQPWMVICLSLVVGITDGLSMPSFQSIVPSIVEKRQIANGIALNSTQFNLSRIVGPAVAGVLMGSLGFWNQCLVLSAFHSGRTMGLATQARPQWSSRRVRVESYGLQCACRVGAVTASLGIADGVDFGRPVCTHCGVLPSAGAASLAW
jgi:MFS family permease